MPRPRLTIGTFDEITTRVVPCGRFEARTRYRDRGGRARQVLSTGATVAAAERALKTRLADRLLFQPTDTHLTPDSLFNDLVTYWLDDIDAEGRISRITSSSSGWRSSPTVAPSRPGSYCGWRSNWRCDTRSCRATQ